MIGVDHRDVMLAQQRDERRRAETVISHFDHMAQGEAIELAWQQVEKGAEVGFVELLGRRELPQYRPKPVAHFRDAGIVEPLDGIPGLGEHTAVGGEPRALDREDEAVRDLAGPFAEAFRLLRAVIGAVDFDRGQLGGGVGQFFRLGQLLRIEHAPPGREGPAADPDMNLT